MLSDSDKRIIYDIYGHKGLKAGWEVKKPFNIYYIILYHYYNYYIYYFKAADCSRKFPINVFIHLQIKFNTLGLEQHKKKSTLCTVLVRTSTVCENSSLNTVGFLLHIIVFLLSLDLYFISIFMFNLITNLIINLILYSCMFVFLFSFFINVILILILLIILLLI